MVLFEYIISISDDLESTNKYKSAAYNYLKSTRLSDTQIEECVQKLASD